MSASTGPVFYHDVSALTITPTTGSALNVFAVTGVKISRQSKRILGYDNNNPRPVASHEVEINERVTISTEDVGAIEGFFALNGTCTIAFTWQPDAQVTGTAETTKTVTISNFVPDNRDVDAKMKAHSSGSIQGTLLGVTAGTDPIAFT